MQTVEVEPTHAVRSEPSMVQWPAHACCCTAPPVVRVVMPAGGRRSTSVEIYLCGHHHRASCSALEAAGATTGFRDRTLALWWRDASGHRTKRP